MDSSKILVTCPGKLGDIIYSLPAVIAMRKHLGGRVFYQTSPFGRPAVPLLAVQPYLDGCFVDESYILQHTHYGCQPYLLAEPEDFSKIFHLGFRPELLGASVLQRHLTETFLIILRQVYGLGLEVDLRAPYLFLGDEPRADFIIFQGFGRTLNDLMPPEAQARLEAFWLELFDHLGRDVKIVSGKEDLSLYENLGCPIVTPDNLLETARLIGQARCFLGVQSVAAAIADGLKVPRLIFHWFENARPRGPGGLTFDLTARPIEVAAALKDYFEL